MGTGPNRYVLTLLPFNGRLVAGGGFTEVDGISAAYLATWTEEVSAVDDQPEIGEIPISFQVSQNYPNPFNPSTTIEYELSHRSRVAIDIFNVVGQKVRSLLNAEKSAGTYKVQWDGRDDNGIPLSTGVYFYRVESDKTAQTKKMLLLK